MKTLFLSFLVCLIAVAHCKDDKGYWLRFTAYNDESQMFAPLRVNKTKAVIDQCGKQVSESYGVLEQTYKLRTTEPSTINCTWNLHAPANHVVNIISISFMLEDEIKPALSDVYKVSTISIYDGAKPDETNRQATYYVTPQEKVSHFVNSLSSKQDMLVEIKYHTHKDFATQKMYITYEFLDVDQMKAFLRAN